MDNPFRSSLWSSNRLKEAKLPPGKKDVKPRMEADRPASLPRKGLHFPLQAPYTPDLISSVIQKSKSSGWSRQSRQGLKIS
jgi:hypothetical protein